MDKRECARKVFVCDVFGRKIDTLVAHDRDDRPPEHPSDTTADGADSVPGPVIVPIFQPVTEWSNSVTGHGLARYWTRLAVTGTT